MATTSQHLLLSPAELAYLHSTLSLAPPLRPDGRTATQFRPLTAETGILPGTNGSARICFVDGTEAVVGVKAEVEKTAGISIPSTEDNVSRSRMRRKPHRKGKGAQSTDSGDDDGEAEDKEDAAPSADERRGENDWLELTVEIPGYRDDDSGTVFLATMLSEALLADGELTKKLWINCRFHWKLYLDIILISPPLSYPLPLLSLTTHLALLATRLPRLKSEGDEDPMFDDDWAASQFIYPRSSSLSLSLSPSPPSTISSSSSRPPITLLVMAVGDNVIFDPSKEELAVADCALAVSVGEGTTTTIDDNDAVKKTAMDMDVDVDVDADAKAGGGGGARTLRLLSVRTIDPPSRLTGPGVPNAVNAAAWGQGGNGNAAKEMGLRAAETGDVEGVWKAPRGGSKIGIISTMVEKIVAKGGVADEALEGLDGVELA
ncbi:hypothetical protein F5Y08DRAFT_155918 [Xylaria arbuscula]|nr:hypothetical protein F5Y08DRAFT_155918 [Xylaria arbuscula]